MTAALAAPTDGRAARRDRNRLAVLDAVIELFAEGVLDPTPEDVSPRVGLSTRSVYRYFVDRDELLRAAIERNVERTLPLLHVHAIGEGPLPDRIDRLVRARLRLYEAVAASYRAARFRGIVDEVVRLQVDDTRRALRVQVEKHFAPELAGFDGPRRRAATAAVDTLLQFDSLELYRVHRGFSSAETRRLLSDSLLVLLDP